MSFKNERLKRNEALIDTEGPKGIKEFPGDLRSQEYPMIQETHVFQGTHPSHGSHTFSQGLSNYTTQRSPSMSQTSSFAPGIRNRNSISDFHLSPQNLHPTSEQVIDMMEREQDGMVLRLMKEIEHLKQENSQLRGQSYGAAGFSPSVRRSSSLSSHRSSISSSGSLGTPATSILSNNLQNSLPFPIKRNSIVPKDRNEEIYINKCKVDTQSIRSRSRANSMTGSSDLGEENRLLKLELRRLKNELEQQKLS